MAGSILDVRALVEVLEHLGIARGDFLSAARFDPSRLHDQEGRVNLEELDELHEVALTLSGNEALGLYMGAMTSATMFSLSAHLVAHATTLRDGIDALLRFYLLLTDRPMWRLLEKDDTATLVCDLLPGPPRCRRFRAEVTMTGFYRMLKHFDRLAQPRRVAFDYAAPSYRAEYTRVFDGAEQFEEPLIGIVFDRRLLDAPQLHRDASLHATLRAEAERRVSRLARSVTYAERVRAQLLASTPDERNMDTVARCLGLSARSLRRRLQEEGFSYHQVVEEALSILAKRLISDEDRPIEAAAYLMGYSDPSAFHRAFKRWTGYTPTAYRLRLRQDDAREG